MVNQELQQLLLEGIANGSVDKATLPHLVDCTLLSHQVSLACHICSLARLNFRLCNTCSCTSYWPSQ